MRAYRKRVRRSSLRSFHDDVIGPFMDDIRAAETRFVACGLHDCLAANNAAADHRLTSASFAFFEMRLLFNAIICAAGIGIRHYELPDLVKLNKWNHRPWGANEAELHALFVLEPDVVLLPDFAHRVAAFAQRLSKVSLCIADAVRLMREPDIPDGERQGTTTNGIPQVLVSRRLARKRRGSVRK